MSCNPSSNLTKNLLLQSEAYDYVRFTFADLHGLACGKTIPRRHLAGVLKDGGQSVYSGVHAGGPVIDSKTDLPGLPECNCGNAYMVPEVGEIFDLPWAGGDRYRVGEILCETRWQDGTHQAMGPRTVARKQLDRLHQAGYKLMTGTEVEFIFFERGDETKPAFDGENYCCHLPFYKYEEVFFDVESQLYKSGIDVEVLHTEQGPGQVELVLKPKYGIESFDELFRCKEAIKETFYKNGHSATFMTKPFPQGSASGFHMNHSLWRVDNGENALYDPEGQDNLSDFARHWVAGLIKHAPALVAICDPTVNCYRRLHHIWAPHKPDWGVDARMASFRVKSSNPSRTYIENRLPSSASNPYLVAAATVAAGLDGVENALPCPPAGSEGLKDLPHSLEESLEDLQADKVITEALGKEFVDWFIPVKKQFEVKKLKGHNFQENVSLEVEKERQLYYRFL